MKILIVEDEFIVADYLASLIVEIGDEVVGQADSVSEAISMLNLKIDLCFLDIRLNNNESGINFGKILQAKQIPFIYLTANNEIETLKIAIATKPENYLTKPFIKRDIIAALELVKIKFPKMITLKTQLGKVVLKQQDILYIESENVNAKIVTSNQTFYQRITLNQLEQELESNFCRIHRSFLVNKDKITLWTNTEVTINEIKIPISRKYKNNF